MTIYAALDQAIYNLLCVVICLLLLRNSTKADRDIVAITLAAIGIVLTFFVQH